MKREIIRVEPLSTYLENWKGADIGCDPPSSRRAPARGRGHCRANRASPAKRERLFDRRVRQVEPMLQEIEAQQPLDRHRRAVISRLIRWRDQLAQHRPRYNALHLGQKCCPPRRLGVAIGG